MKTILVSAYAVNPFKGSEDGMGWNFILQIARFHKVIAVTRENNRAEIERYIDANPDERYDRVQWEYYDLPQWSRWWKRGALGAMPYYLLWQRFLPGFVQRRGLQFDVAHNLNFHNDWTPSYLWKLGKPFAWGPVGHHPQIPAQYLKDCNLGSRVADRLRWGLKQAFWHFSPGLARTRAQVDHVWFMNSKAAQRNRIHNGKISVLPSVASEDHGFAISPDFSRFQLVSAGRLIPLKGFDLSIRSFAAFVWSLPENERLQCELLIVGKGPEKVKYETLIAELGVAQYVRLLDWVPRVELMAHYRSANGFLFPSHEGAGMVVAEALSFGLPVICLDNEGPGEFVDDSCGIAVPMQGYAETVKSLAEAIARLHEDSALQARLRIGARARYETSFHWDRRGEALREIYQSILS